MGKVHSLTGYLLVLAAVCGIACQAAQGQDADGLRIIAFGAHPDDCEIRCGGVGILWNQRGDLVKFVSTTNGDIGHWGMAGGALAKRRNAEVQAAAAVLGVSCWNGIRGARARPTRRESISRASCLLE